MRRTQENTGERRKEQSKAGPTELAARGAQYGWASSIPVLTSTCRSNRTSKSDASSTPDLRLVDFRVWLLGWPCL